MGGGTSFSLRCYVFQCLTALRVFCFSGRTACPLIFADLTGLQKTQKTDLATRIVRGYPPPVSRWDAVRHYEGRGHKHNGNVAKVRDDRTVKTRSGRSAVPYRGSETWFVYRTRGKNQKVLRDGKPVPYRIRDVVCINGHKAKNGWFAERSKPFPT